MLSDRLDAVTPLCARCGDTGSVRVHGAEDYGVSFEAEACTACRLGKAHIAVEQAEWELYEARREVDAHSAALGKDGQ